MAEKRKHADESLPIVPASRGQMDKSANLAGADEYNMTGLSIPMATLFILGELVGGALLTLPKAIENAGVIGIVFLFVAWLMLTYTGNLLAKSWSLMRHRYPEYRGHVRYPYPAIGEATYGRPGRVFISTLVFAGLYCTFVVYILIVTNNFGQLLNEFGQDIRFSYRLFIVGGIVLPITWLGSPKDFWWVGIVASFTPIVSAVLLLAKISSDGLKLTATVEHTTPTLVGITMSFGTSFYAFGGHFTFPTIQVDMINPDKFHYSAVSGEIGAALMYIPVALFSYFVYGIHTKDTILLSLSPGPLLYITQLLITIHFLGAIIIVCNPVYQEVEELFNVPKVFTWKRCVARSGILLSAILVALLVPNFFVIVALLGGTSTGLLASVFPVLFYWKLSSMEGNWEKMNIPLVEKLLYSALIAFGLACCCMSTVSSVYMLVQDFKKNFNSTSPV